MKNMKIATGIWKRTSSREKKPFLFSTQGKIRNFETEREARVAKCVHLAIRSLLKKRYDSLSLEEKRKENVQKCGNNSNLERQVAIKIKAMMEQLFPGIELIILNDGTRADFLLQRSDGLFLQVQLKTTNGPLKNQNNCWEFTHVLGYTRMPVLCWRIDQQSGWLYDGAVLDERGTEGLKVTPGFDNEKKAMHKGAFNLDEICKFLVKTMHKFPGVDRISASWDFCGEAITTFKERISLEIWKICFDPEATFPNDQNGSYDLLSEGKRLQFKTASRRLENRRRLKVTFYKYGGRVDGKKKNQPYTSGSFDAAVVMFIDWKLYKIHIWKIPEDILIKNNLLKTENCKGKQGFDVYIPAEKHTLRKSGGRVVADTWTHDFYIGTKDMPKFGIEAETVAARFFAECRNSK